MPKLALLLALVVAAYGCERRPDATPPAPEVPAPREAPKVAEFKAAVADYLAEARAGAKLLTLAPSRAAAAEQAARITRLYTRLPDPPAGTAPEVAGWLKNVNGTFAAAEFLAELAERAARIPGNGGQVKEIYGETLPDAAREVRELADKIEAAVFPKK